MKQYQVPQFITIEDKVIGPLTIKQFLYLLGGVGVIVVTRYLLIPLFFFPIAFAAAVFSFSLAFLKIKDVPLPTIVKNSFWYQMQPHIYVWKKEQAKKQPATAVPKSEVTIRSTPRLSESKLSDLAWSLNIKEKLRPEEGETPESLF